MARKISLGIIGCGRISGQYLWMAKQFPLLEVLACADLNVDVARAKAAEFNVPRGCSVPELLADPAIELVLNLTIPVAHAPASLQALRAAKHRYCEKPLG